MMEEGGTNARIKQEIDSCCSPSPSPSSNNVSIINFGSGGQETVSHIDKYTFLRNVIIYKISFRWILNVVDLMRL